MRLEAEFFLALKPSLQCHKTYVKEGFPDKVTGLWAFEGQMPYQKYQGPPIVVRWIIITGSKSLKKGQKIVEKSHKFGLKSLFQKKIWLDQFEIYQ